MDKKQYKRIDWSKLPPINNTYSGCTNGNHLDIEINIDKDTPIILDDCISQYQSHKLFSP